MKRKGMIFAVCLLLVGLMAVNGTLAQGVASIFQTLTGNNAPQQDETLLQVRLVHQVRGDNGLVEGQSRKTLIPVGYPASFSWENSKVSTQVGNAAYLLWDTSLMNGAIDKFTSVKNMLAGVEGAKDAYFRLAFAVDKNIYSKLKLNFNTAEAAYDWGEWTEISIKNRPFMMKIATYTKALVPGEIAPPALLQVAMDKSATNEDYEKISSDFLQIKVMAVDADTLTTGSGEQTVRPGAVETLNQTVPVGTGFNPF